MESRQNIFLKLVTVFMILIATMLAVPVMQGYFSGKFNSVQSLQEYIREFGVFAPCALILIQAFQVVIPVLPGIIGCMVGVLLFGPFWGFAYNYIGICAGSIMAYYLAKKCGAPIIEYFFKGEKYSRLTNKLCSAKSYTMVFLFSILLPQAPDDFLCYLSGVIKMPTHKFVSIILLAKPWCIMFYSCIFGLGWSFM